MNRVPPSTDFFRIWYQARRRIGPHPFASDWWNRPPREFDKANTSSVDNLHYVFIPFRE